MFNVRGNLAPRESEFVEIGAAEAILGDGIRRRGLVTFRKALLNGKTTEACA
jgi:hypothetical protein